MEVYTAASLDKDRVLLNKCVFIALLTHASLVTKEGLAVILTS